MDRKNSPVRAGTIPSPYSNYEPVQQAKTPSLLRMYEVCDYVCWLQGCVLFTAPHSLKLCRGGAATRGYVRTHPCERWTGEIALTLARELHRDGLSASMMVWNQYAAPNHSRLDPNFLAQGQFASSPWHRALHRWALTVGGAERSVPLMHIDLHGKVSERLHLDLGVAPLEELWPHEDQGFVADLKCRFADYLDQALAECDVRSASGQRINVDCHPTLHGYWGEGTVATLSHQSVSLGIPAVQLEMPPSLRGRLVEDVELARLFGSAISRIYRETITPWWTARIMMSAPWPCDTTLSSALAARLQENGPADAAGFEMWSTQALEELLHLDSAVVVTGPWEIMFLRHASAVAVNMSGPAVAQGDTTVVVALACCLQDADMDMRFAVVDTLHAVAERCDESGVEALEQLFKDASALAREFLLPRVQPRIGFDGESGGKPR